MKKTLFALAGVLTLALTSCFEGTGSSYTSTFSRVVTIDTLSSPVKLIADYTGEEFNKFTNLRTPEQLAQFDLEDALRAEVIMQVYVDESYTQTWTMLQGKKIDIQPVTNKVLTDSLMPLSSLYPVPYITPLAWVSEGYLNVIPVIPSGESGKYHLTPEKAINDTLYFNLTTTYKEDSLKAYKEDIQCYDLRTLRDTTNADAELRTKMEEILTAMEQHRTDSVKIILTGRFIEYNYDNLGNDTIRTINVITNSFKYNF